MTRAEPGAYLTELLRRLLRCTTCRSIPCPRRAGAYATESPTAFRLRVSTQVAASRDGKLLRAHRGDKHRTSNRQGHHLSTTQALRLLENYGVSVENEHIQ